MPPPIRSSSFSFSCYADFLFLLSFPTRRSSDLSDWLGLSCFSLKCRAAAVGPARQQPRGIDRKSTRLNSSHLGISYAVFCLKKKKKKNKVRPNNQYTE